MSHGKLDLSGSRVFGWYTLDKNRSDYLAGAKLPGLTAEEIGAANTKGRNDLLVWARQAASAKLADHGPFFSVGCMNVQTDLFGSLDGVVCDDERMPTVNGADTCATGMSSMSPSLLGQEMGHAYGLKHSRAYGSTDDYMDQWDVMSTANTCLMAAHPNFTELNVRDQPIFRLGPGLNAVNMWGRGWLDESRVWSSTSDAQVNTTVQLRPLHRRDLSGFLAIRFQGYFVEFRTNTGWDAAVTPTVLVHTFQRTPFEGSHSYLVSDSNGQQAFGVGSFIGMPDNMSVLSSNTRIEVIEIDAGQQFAKVRLVHTPAAVSQYFEEDRPYRNPGVAWSDVGGRGDALIVMDGIGVRISRRSPFFRTIEQIALLRKQRGNRLHSVAERCQRGGVIDYRHCHAGANAHVAGFSTTRSSSTN